MKKIVIITILVLSLFIIRIPKYVELNNLAIIRTIGIDYDNNTYRLYLKEIVPYKSDEGISYKYKYYESSSSSLKNAFKLIENKTTKKIYLNKVDLIIIDKKKKKTILKKLNKKTNHYIYTIEDIKKVIRKY